jgi:hypothetical protein
MTEEQVQALITLRLIEFERALVERGQIQRTYPPEPPRTTSVSESARAGDGAEATPDEVTADISMTAVTRAAVASALASDSAHRASPAVAAPAAPEDTGEERA